MRKYIVSLLIILVFVFVGCSNTEVLTSTQEQTTSEVTTDLLTTSDLIQTTEDIQTTDIPTSIETTTEVITTTEVMTTTEVTVDGIAEVMNVEDHTVIVNHYFNPMLDVVAYSQSGKDITALMTIEGYVDYGTIGSYELTYELLYEDDLFTQTVTVDVIDGVYHVPSGSRPLGLNGRVVIGYGSYFTGTDTRIIHPRNPGYLSPHLLEEAIPSSGWWTSLLAENLGGGNGIYTNPLRTSFTNQGLEITNPLDGFVQYWNPEGYQTIAQFPIALKDMFLSSSDLSDSYLTQVIDYSDFHVKVSMKNDFEDEDEMVVTLVQGSPYVFVETANRNALTLTMDGSVTIEYYNLQGQLITDNVYQGDAIIVKMVQRHSGYDTSPPANVGQPEFTDKYYLINVPDHSTFNINQNILGMSLADGNYLSIAAINNLSEALFYHQHAYSMIHKTQIDYMINHQESLVYTDYMASIQKLRTDQNSEGLLSLMPHHYKYSQVMLSDYSYRTVRGTLKVMEGHHFQTVLPFNGLLPGYTLPNNDAYDHETMLSYLNDLDQRIDMSDMDHFINDEAPYWNGKALYPLAQGLIIADQIGNETLKASFIEKLRYILIDWYTYSDSSDDKYLYYNQAWGSVYYSNDEFGTASGLSDHSFTHGYLIYASAVLAMYDDGFVEDYGMIVELLLDDYMYTDKADSDFAYLRNFDPWAGHTWAHGFGTFAEGNNLESTSEALNSWNAGYLWALATQDEERMNAAIYGFATEISAAKEYFFDYDEENWDSDYRDYADVVGILWGGKHDYATWFGANPTFIYGIQWLPTGEYLTSYAMNQDEHIRLSAIYASYLASKNGEIDTWYSNMWAIQAIINSDIAIAEFDASKILNDDYPAELSGTYWMIHALDTLGSRYQDIWMGIQIGVSSSIYQDASGNVYAMVWNPTDQVQLVEFYNEQGLISTEIIQANTFVKVQIQP